MDTVAALGDVAVAEAAQAKEEFEASVAAEAVEKARAHLEAVKETGDEGEISAAEASLAEAEAAWEIESAEAVEAQGVYEM